MATISGVPSPFAQRNHISSNRLRKQLRKDSDTVFIQKLTETMVQHIKLRIILMCTLLIPVLARLLSRISYYIIYSIQYNFFLGGGGDSKPIHCASVGQPTCQNDCLLLESQIFIYVTIYESINKSEAIN